MLFQSIQIVSYPFLVVLVLALMLPIRVCYALFIITAPLTTLAVIQFGDDNILIFQLMWLVLTIKIVVSRFLTNVQIPKVWLVFLIYSLFSTLFVIFFPNTLVINVDGQLEFAKSSYQQYTQWMYLLMAITSAWYTAYMIRLKFISIDQTIKFMNIGGLLVILVAMLQLILPAEIINEFFRNSVHTGYAFEGARVSSTFGEPSMVSAYIVPLASLNLFLLLKKPNVISAIIVTMSLVISYLNYSSSAIIGYLVLLISLVLILGFSAKNLVMSKSMILVIMIASVILIILIASGVFDFAIQELQRKLRGENYSGVDRAYSAAICFDAFLDNPIFGIGWGVARSKDLLMTWLCEVGMVGMLLFFVPLIKIIYNIYSGYIKRLISYEKAFPIISYIIVALAIMLISVPEPYYFSFWIVCGMGISFEEEGRFTQRAVIVMKSREYNNC